VPIDAAPGARRAIIEAGADTRRMTPTTWILVALGAALVAMAVSGLGRGGAGARQFVGDLRSAVRREPDPGAGAPGHARHELGSRAEDEEGGLDDLFTFGEQPSNAYIEPAEMAQPFARVTQRAVGGLRGRVPRRSEEGRG